MNAMDPNMPHVHVSVEEIEDLIDGVLSPEDNARVRGMAAGCAECTSTIARLTAYTRILAGWTARSHADTLDAAYEPAFKKRLAEALVDAPKRAMEHGYAALSKRLGEMAEVIGRQVAESVVPVVGTAGSRARVSTRWQFAPLLADQGIPGVRNADPPVLAVLSSGPQPIALRTQGLTDRVIVEIGNIGVLAQPPAAVIIPQEPGAPLQLQRLQPTGPDSCRMEWQHGMGKGVVVLV